MKDKEYDLSSLYWTPTNNVVSRKLPSVLPSLFISFNCYSYSCQNKSPKVSWYQLFWKMQ